MVRRQRGKALGRHVQRKAHLVPGCLSLTRCQFSANELAPGRLIWVGAVGSCCLHAHLRHFHVGEEREKPNVHEWMRRRPMTAESAEMRTVLRAPQAVLKRDRSRRVGWPKR